MTSAKFLAVAVFFITGCAFGDSPPSSGQCLMQKKLDISHGTKFTPRDVEEEEKIDEKLDKSRASHRLEEEIRHQDICMASLANGASGSGGPTPVELTAMATASQAQMRPVKRSLGLSTSDPSDPAPVGSPVLDTTSRRVHANTGGDTREPVNSFAPLVHASTGGDPDEPVNRSAPLVNASTGGDLPEPGSEADLWVPCDTHGRYWSPCWHFFRRWKSDDAELRCQAHCIIAGCRKSVVKLTGGGTSNLWTHLQRHHRLTRAMATDQASGTCKCGRCPNDPRVPHGRELTESEELDVRAQALAEAQQEALRKMEAQAAFEGVGLAQGKIALKMAPASSHRVTQAFTRQIVVLHQRPGQMVEDEGFKNFVRTLSHESHASFLWEPPQSMRSVGRIIEQDYTSMGTLLRKEIISVPTHGLNFHHDVWTDEHKRNWIAGYFFYLSPQTWEPTYLLGTLDNLGMWSSEDIGSSHSSAAMATALRSSLRLDMSLEDHWPMWVLSDNAGPAVAVGGLLHMRGLRCMSHLLMIPMKRLFFQPSGRTPAPLPAHLAALESLRAFSAYYYHKSDHQQAMLRVQTARDLPGSLPWLDSSSKWHSTLKMCRVYHESVELFEAAAARNEFGDHPVALSPDERALIEEVLQILEALEAAVTLLDKDDALLAEYMPIAAALRHRMLQIGTEAGQAYLTELDAAEHRHLDQELPAMGQWASWPSLRDFMECASLLHPTYRQGKWIPVEQQKQRQEQCARHLLTCFIRAHGIEDPHDPLDVSLMAAPLKPAPSASSAKREKAGMEDLLVSMNTAVISVATQPRDAGQPPQSNPPPGQMTASGYIKQLSRAHFLAPPVTDVTPWEYWRDNEQFSALAPGAWSLLSHSASNGWGERLFSRTENALSNKRVFTVNLKRKIMLLMNARKLHMPGYN